MFLYVYGQNKQTADLISICQFDHHSI